jgi:hypothetical protein
MLAHIRFRQPAQRTLAALVVALTLATQLAPTPLIFAQAASSNAACPDPGPVDYPVAGGWFYTQEGRGCITGVGPPRHRGYLVRDDSQGGFWTEFRRFGGIDVLGYPVSQRFHYPASDDGGYWYQGFERGILKWHPETGRAEMANVYEMFTEQGLDPQLEALGIPQPESRTDSSFAADAERRMAWLTEPRFLARYFFDPVGAHSSDPRRLGQTTFATQEEAWGFFGLPQSHPAQPFLQSGSGPACTFPETQSPCRVSLDPLVHTFIAQRFQKGGMQLFLQGSPTETFAPAGWSDIPSYLLDPTIVPGDGVKGCVALTAVGLLARGLGADKIIPSGASQPLPLDPSPRPFIQSFIPPVDPGQLMVQFQLMGSGFSAGQPITIRLTDARPAAMSAALPPRDSHVTAANRDGSFDQILTTRVGTYELVVTSDVSLKTYDGILDLNTPTLSTAVTNSTTCRDVGLPVQAANNTATQPATPSNAATSPTSPASPNRARLTN